MSSNDHTYPTSQSPNIYFVNIDTINGIMINLEKLDLFSKRDNIKVDTATKSRVVNISTIGLPSHFPYVGVICIIMNNILWGNILF